MDIENIISIKYDTLDELFKHKKETNRLHNHTRIMYDFINSDYYSSELYYSYKSKQNKDYSKKQLLEQNMNNVIEYEKTLNEKKNITKDDILVYVDFLITQLSIETDNENMYCRFDCVRNINEQDKINLNISLKKVKQLRECNKNNNWDVLMDGTWGWHKEYISLIWNLILNGYADYAIELLEPVYELRKITIDEDFDVLNKIFNFNIFMKSYNRSVLSIFNPLAMSYRQQGNDKKYLEILKEIITYTIPDNIYRINTRLLENAISIYKKERTTTNKNIVYNMLDSCLSTKPIEPTESIMERCLIMYDLLSII